MRRVDCDLVRAASSRFFRAAADAFVATSRCPANSLVSVPALVLRRPSSALRVSLLDTSTPLRSPCQRPASVRPGEIFARAFDSCKSVMRAAGQAPRLGFPPEWVSDQLSDYGPAGS